jgi:hypothetical protein
MATKPGWFLAGVFGGTASLFVVAVSGLAFQRVFLTQAQGRWCSYASEKLVEDAPKDQDPEYIAIAEAHGGHLTAIRIRRSTEDTTTYDDYSLGRDGLLRRLKRSLDDVSEKITRVQNWDISSGRPVKVSESWFEFGTHRSIPRPNQLDDFIDQSIIMRTVDFPFYVLLTSPGVWANRTVCVAGDAKKLEAPERR